MKIFPFSFFFSFHLTYTNIIAQSPRKVKRNAQIIFSILFSENGDIFFSFLHFNLY